MSCYHDHPLISSESFRILIRERTDERKRKIQEKRQAGRRRIVEMKSKNGANPLDLFPKELWLKIMDTGTCTPEDRGNMVQIHPVFENLMADNLISDILFPQAIKLVMDRIKNDDYCSWFHSNEISASLISPFLKLREVSKSLRLAVDRWFEEKIIEELHQYPDKPVDWNPVPRMVFVLGSDQTRLNRLIENFSPTTTTSEGGVDEVTMTPPAKCRRSFFLRSIEVAISTTSWAYEDPGYDEQHFRNDTFLPFRTALLQLLRLIGNQILCFKLRVNSIDYFDIIGIGVGDHYYLLQQCCELMPNLKKLEVYFEMAGWMEESKEPGSLATFIERHPFPTLDKLEKISLTQDQNIYSTLKIYDAVLKANSHVKMLKLIIDDHLLEKVYQDALEALHLEYFSWENTSREPSSPTSSIDLINKDWPLKMLKIHVHSQSLNSVFQSLKAFPSLEKLTLFLTDTEIGKNLEFLLLPNLTHFEFSFTGDIDLDRDDDDVNFLFSLHFLLHAKRLKWIRWTYLAKDEHILQKYLECHKVSEKMIDFMNGRRDLSSSNVWRVFPELEMVEVEVPKTSGRGTIMKNHYRPG